MSTVLFSIKSNDNKSYTSIVTELLQDYFSFCGVGEHLATIKGLDQSKEYVFKFNMGKVTSDVVKKPHLVKVKTIREGGRSICMQVGTRAKEKGAVTIYLLMPDPKVNINNLFNLLKNPERSHKEIGKQSVPVVNVYTPPTVDPQVSAQVASVEETVKVLLVYIYEDGPLSKKALDEVIATAERTGDAVPVDYFEFLKSEGYIVETATSQWQLTPLGREQIADNIEEETGVVEPAITPPPTKKPSVQEQLDRLEADMERHQALQADLRSILDEEAQFEENHKITLEILQQEYKAKNQRFADWKQAAKDEIKLLEKSVTKYRQLQKILDL